MTPSRYGPISDLRLVVSGDLKAVQRACAAPSVPTLIKLVRKGSGQLIFARASRSERMCGRDGELVLDARQCDIHGPVVQRLRVAGLSRSPASGSSPCSSLP
jgi:hypothetical protein